MALEKPRVAGYTYRELEASLMPTSIIDFERLDRDSGVLAYQWRNARPFEHVVIDNFADPKRLAAIHRQFPDPRTLNKSRDYIFAKEKYKKTISTQYPKI